MGVEFRDLVTPRETSFEDLSNRTLAIDAFNAIYQFLAIIRQPDGTPLKDMEGRVTSHLSGLFYRTINFLEKKITPIYVFDGKPPQLKSDTIAERKKIRTEMKQKWQYALRKGDLTSAKKYAQGASRLTFNMADESKALLTAMGVPVIQAPGEGEAQAVQLVKQEEAWACVSQDYDAILYNTPRLIRNLTTRGQRKVPRQNRYITISPEILETPNVLHALKLTQNQLIDVGIMIGTDYNKNIPGVGPKTALKLILQYGSIENILKETKKSFPEETPFEEIREIFLNPEVDQNLTITRPELDPDTLQKILFDDHQFSLSRVENGIRRIQEAQSKQQQGSLVDYF